MTVKLGDVLTFNMVHANNNEPCAGIVTKVAGDGAVSATVFPVNSASVSLVNVPSNSLVDETYVSYVDPSPAAPAEPETSIPG